MTSSISSSTWSPRERSRGTTRTRIRISCPSSRTWGTPIESRERKGRTSMDELNRRDFLKVAGAGSAVLAAIGTGVIATGKVLRTHGSDDDATAPLAFRATAGLPQKPYPAYASLVVDGSVDTAAGTGSIRRVVYAGAPDAMSPAVFPGTERSYNVTRLAEHGDQLSVWARVADRSSLEAGESPTIQVSIDRRTGDVVAPFVGRQLTLTP